MIIDHQQQQQQHMLIILIMSFIMKIAFEIYQVGLLFQEIMVLIMITMMVLIVVYLMIFLAEKERVAEVMKEGECLVDKLLDEIRRGTNLRQRASR